MRSRLKYLYLATLFALLCVFSLSCRTCNCPAYSEAKNTIGSPHLEGTPNTTPENEGLNAKQHV